MRKWGNVSWRSLLTIGLTDVYYRGETPFRLLRFKPAQDSLCFYAIDGRGVLSDTACLVEMDCSGKKIKWTDGIAAIWTLVRYRFVD